MTTKTRIAHAESGSLKDLGEMLRNLSGIGPDDGVIATAALADEAVTVAKIEDGIPRTLLDDTTTLAEVNAGHTIIPGLTGKKLVVLDFALRVVGTWATGTTIVLEDNTSGTDVMSIAQADADDSLHTPALLTTLGAGFGSALATSEGLKFGITGSNFTGGTSIISTITYAYV